MLLLNIEMKCATNIQLPAEKNKELFLEWGTPRTSEWGTLKECPTLYIMVDLLNNILFRFTSVGILFSVKSFTRSPTVVVE